MVSSATIIRVEFASKLSIKEPEEPHEDVRKNKKRFKKLEDNVKRILKGRPPSRILNGAEPMVLPHFRWLLLDYCCGVEGGGREERGGRRRGGERGRKSRGIHRVDEVDEREHEVENNNLHELSDSGEAIK